MNKCLKPFEKVIVLGDGKLGLITALTLNAQNIDVTLVGKHQNKLDIARNQGVQTKLLNDLKVEKTYDVVVEATGSISGFETALALTKPRGVLVLKSTVAASKEFNLAPIVIDEIESGAKREVSAGYECEYVEREGKYYQTNIRGNHVALVQQGRAGKMVCIKDEQPKETTIHAKRLLRKAKRII